MDFARKLNQYFAYYVDIQEFLVNQLNRETVKATVFVPQ